VKEIPKDELLTQLREAVAILAASAAEQVQWLTQGVPAPVDELMMQYSDIVPSWFSLLRRHGVIDTESEAALAALQSEFETMVKLGDNSLWESDDALYLHPEWEHIRELARIALTKIDKTGSARA
jgi:hypothetical protein